MYYSNIFDTVHACISVLYQCDKYVYQYHNGCQKLVDWNDGMEQWNGILGSVN